MGGKVGGEVAEAGAVKHEGEEEEKEEGEEERTRCTGCESMFKASHVDDEIDFKC